jgi:hypothetical protein
MNNTIVLGGNLLSPPCEVFHMLTIHSRILTFIYFCFSFFFKKKINKKEKRKRKKKKEKENTYFVMTSDEIILLREELRTTYIKIFTHMYEDYIFKCDFLYRFLNIKQLPPEGATTSIIKACQDLFAFARKHKCVGNIRFIAWLLGEIEESYFEYCMMDLIYAGIYRGLREEGMSPVSILRGG